MAIPTVAPLEVSSFEISFEIKRNNFIVSEKNIDYRWVMFSKVMKFISKQKNYNRNIDHLPSWERMLNSRHWTLLTAEKEMISGGNQEYQEKKCSQPNTQKTIRNNHHIGDFAAYWAAKDFRHGDLSSTR